MAARQQAPFDFQFKVIVIGDSSVGKTCLLLQYTDGRFQPQHDTTVGVDYGSKTFRMDGKVLQLTVWDTAGQEVFRSIVRSYYRASAIAILVFDVTKPSTFESLATWLEDMSQHANRSIVPIIVGNKVYESFCRERNILYFETSAKTGENVNRMFETAAGIVLRKITTNDIEPMQASNHVFAQWHTVIG